MFFNFARFFPQQQQLDGLLEKGDCDLELILSTEGILQEIKGQGAQKFADFVTQNPEMYQRMINYIITFEDELIDRKTQIQFPFLVSEILGSQNQKLIDFLFPEKNEQGEEIFDPIRTQLYYQLLSFLENDVLNVTSAGYFAKAFIAILKKRGFDVWATILKNNTILNNLIKHIDIRHISEIIEKLIILDTSQESQDETIFTARKLLLQRIMKLLEHKMYNIEIVDNVCEILIEITSKSMSSLYYNNGEIIPFIDIIKKPEFILDVALKTQRPGPYLLLINLVEMQSKETKKEDDDEVVHNLEKDYTLFESISSELPRNLLQQDYSSGSFQNSNKQIIKPFGIAKMHLLKLIQVLVQTNDEKIIKNLLNNNLIEILQYIIIRHDSNNQIHTCCDKILRSIIESNIDEFIQDIFEKNRLIQFIIANHIPDHSKFGYVGFLTALANYIDEKSKSNNIIMNAFDDEQWNEFQDKILRDINQKEKNFLCGINPRPSQEEPLDPSETDNIISILRKFNSNFQARNQEQKDKENQVSSEENQESEKKEENINYYQENLENDDDDDDSDNVEQDSNNQQNEGSDNHQTNEKREYIDSQFWKLPSKEEDSLFENYH